MTDSEYRRKARERKRLQRQREAARRRGESDDRTRFPCGHPRTTTNTYCRPDTGVCLCLTCKREARAQAGGGKPGEQLKLFAPKNYGPGRRGRPRKAPYKHRAHYRQPHLPQFNKPRGRARNWRRQGINLTQEQFDQMLVDQGERCAICGEKQQLVPDHDHQTGHVRGLLCDACNLGIGQLADDVERVQRAANYLRGA